MKVVAVGAGTWGKNIVKNLHAMGALVGIVEANENSHEALAAEYPGIPLFTVPEDAYDRLEPDAITIATPAPTHFDIAMVALERDLHCFVEKPITLVAREAEALVQTAEERGRTLMAGHLLLFQPAIVKLKEAIDSGLIGELQSIHQERLNLGRARAVENVLWSLGVHDVAVALYLIGDAPKRIGFSGHAALNPTIEDDVYLHMQFESGVQSHLHCSWLWPKVRRRTVVVGSQGMLVFKELEKQIVFHKKWIDDNLQNVNEGEEIIFEGADEPLRLELEHFVHCCQTGETPRSCGRSAMEVIRVLEAAFESDENARYAAVE
ncbi:MAG: Gfo/Idh/MocA family oxidoreductase [Armatimonadetes bacterium]|nr:Gfo/Idh/MocA family oxidoreductase [Armatimonadota bacterium]